MKIAEDWTCSDHFGLAPAVTLSATFRFVEGNRRFSRSIYHMSLPHVRLDATAAYSVT
jgi:hypothetical protein